MKKLIVAIAAMGMVSFGMAQPPAKGDMGPDGKGPRHGMHQKGQHRGGPAAAFGKLNLTDAQKEQMKAIDDDYRGKMETLMKKEDITVKQQRDERAALAKAHKAKVESILTADQKKQLADMKANAQKRGDEMAAKRLDRMKTDLALTDAQVAKIKKSQDASRSKMQAIMQNDNLDRESKREQAMALRSDMKKTMDEVLTPEQKTKWEEMRKEHQKMEPRRGRGFGPGPGPEPVK